MSNELQLASERPHFFPALGRGKCADCWVHGTRVGTRVSRTEPGCSKTRVLTSLVAITGLFTDHKLHLYSYALF